MQQRRLFIKMLYLMSLEKTHHNLDFSESCIEYVLNLRLRLIIIKMDDKIILTPDITQIFLCELIDHQEIWLRDSCLFSEKS